MFERFLGASRQCSFYDKKGDNDELIPDCFVISF